MRAEGESFDAGAPQDFVITGFKRASNSQQNPIRLL